jgi:hypothetical protein
MHALATAKMHRWPPIARRAFYLPSRQARTLLAVPPRRKRHFSIETGLQKLATNAAEEVA